MDTRQTSAKPGPRARNGRAAFLAPFRTAGGSQFLSSLPELAMPEAVREVDHEPHDHPDQQPVPVLDRQREHQYQTEQDAEDRHDGIERRAERTLRVGVRS